MAARKVQRTTRKAPARRKDSHPDGPRYGRFQAKWDSGMNAYAVFVVDSSGATTSRASSWNSPMSLAEANAMAKKESARENIHKEAIDPLDDEVIHEDLTNPGNPAELEGPGESGEIIKEEEEAPFEPKDSAMKAAMAYANLKAIKSAFGEGGEHDLNKMDHPGMREGLKELIEDGGHLDKAMEHVRNLVGEHHADLGDAGEALDKMCKSLDSIEEDQPSVVMHDVEPLEPDAPTTEIKDDSFMQGEDNLVDSGAVPEGDLEPINYDEAGTTDAEVMDAADEDKQHGSDQDTEEILERYQHPKTGQWGTRVVGKAWRAKNGRIYMRKAESYDVYVKENGQERLYRTINNFKDAIRLATDLQSKYGRSNVRIDGPKQGKSVEQVDDGGTEPYGKDLANEGNPAEFNTPPETGAIIKDEHLDAIGKAADHLDAMGAGYSAAPETHKEHADALRQVHNDLSDMGNPQEIEGPHKDGTDGAVGGGDLTEGVEELKDVDEDDGMVKSAAKQAIADAKATINELRRKGRMYRILN